VLLSVATSNKKAMYAACLAAKKIAVGKFSSTLSIERLLGQNSIAVAGLLHIWCIMHMSHVHDARIALVRCF
jgi:hypothetical protein